MTFRDKQDRVYDAESFRDNVAIIARDLADGPTHLQGFVKETFHEGWFRALEDCTEHECANILKSLDHPYAAERLGAFLRGEKTDRVSVRLP